MSPQKVWRDIFLKAFHGRWGTNFWGKIYCGTVQYGGLLIRLCHGQGSFANAFSGNLKTVNFKMFANHEGIYTWIESPDQSKELCKYLFLRLIVKSFQRLSCSAWPWYIVCKVNSTNKVLHLKSTLCTLCLRGWRFHATAVFICNILKSDLYIDVSFTELF